MRKTFGRVLILGLFLGLASVQAHAQAAGQNHEDREGQRRRLHLRGSYSFRLVPATSFAPFYDGTNGKDSGVVAAPRQDILRVGTLRFDGLGNFTGHTIATTDDGLTTVVIDFNFSGTYIVNIDGTGTLSVTAADVTDASCTPAQTAGTCATFEGPETYAFVLNNRPTGRFVSLIETDNEGGGAKIFLTGEAHRR